MIQVLVRAPYVRIETSVVIALAAVVVIGASVVTAGSLMVTRASVKDEARQSVCAEKVRAFKARNPLASKGHLARPTPCQDLAALSGEVIE